ncbi:hypothetical protein C8R45DRAFT_976425, partial [Mycena sanguinolenta]
SATSVSLLLLPTIWPSRLPSLSSLSTFSADQQSPKSLHTPLRVNTSPSLRTAHVVSFTRRFRWTDLQRGGDFYRLQYFKTSRRKISRQQDFKTSRSSRPQRSGSSPLRGAQCGRAESRDGCARGLAP